MNSILDNSIDSIGIRADWEEEHGGNHKPWRIGLAAYAGVYIGIGIGSGSGRGSGIGIGIGSGSGSGSGSGIGSGIGKSVIQGVEMESGKAYLIHSGDWHSFVGRYVEQTSPLLHKFESVSKIRETNNGDCWGELAADMNGLREAIEVSHIYTSFELPISIGAMEWVGQTPQESEKKA